MQIKKNFSLKNLNTFAIDVKAKYFVDVKRISELVEILKMYKNEQLFILGGGSNTLFVRDWNGLMVQLNIKGKKAIRGKEGFVYVECFSGEIWDDFVEWTIRNKYSGVENMIMIPGTVGGAVAQNIAAYGQNITDVLYEIQILDSDTGKEKIVKPEECGFKYRFSKFKSIWKNKYIITKVIFKLKKDSDDLELSYHERAGRYGSILQELESFAEEPYSLEDVAQAVKNQREKRLPSVEEFGTCGSFFQNPVVSLKKFEDLEKKIPDLQCYPVEGLNYTHKKGKDFDFVKIPAGRLLDELGWKGRWKGDVGVSEKHALCIVTNKKATGEAIWNFSKEMKKSVLDKYGVELIEEVNIVT